MVQEINESNKGGKTKLLLHMEKEILVASKRDIEKIFPGKNLHASGKSGEAAKIFSQQQHRQMGSTIKSEV